MTSVTARGKQAAAMSTQTVRTFFIATFALSWGAGMLFTVFSTQVEAWFGPMGYTNPAFILIVYAPGIVALWLVARHDGIRRQQRRRPCGAFTAGFSRAMRASGVTIAACGVVALAFVGGRLGGGRHPARPVGAHFDLHAPPLRSARPFVEQVRPHAPGAVGAD